MSTDYIYAVARVRYRETKLLSGSFIESLLSAKDYSECLRMLSDHGWNTDGAESTPAKMFEQEKRETWDFVSEIVHDGHAFDVFRYANDYHNLKAAIKNTLSRLDEEGLYMDKSMCTIDPLTIKKAIHDRDFRELPSDMEKVAGEALDLLLHTGDGQACDIMLDRAALDRIHKAGKETKEPILSLYAELTVASADIKTAIRACIMGKDASFLEKALADCDTLDIGALAKAASTGIEAIYEYLERTPYADAIDDIKISPSAFEKWCDNTIIRKMRPQIHNSFTLGPVAAYIIARENEIKTVRIILSGKQNKLPDESLRERVREMYV